MLCWVPRNSGWKGAEFVAAGVWCEVSEGSGGEESRGDPSKPSQGWCQAGTSALARIKQEQGEAGICQYLLRGKRDQGEIDQGEMDPVFNCSCS